MVAKFDKEKAGGFDEEGRKCIICLGEFEHGEEMRFLPCTHRYHRVCIDPWLETHQTCPSCKKNFQSMNSII